MFRPIPPWYLQQPSLQSNSELWLQNSAQSRHVSDITGDDQTNNIKSSYNSRIPILVATTTQTPKRIPITTPKPTTTTSTTTTEETTETVVASTSEVVESYDDTINHDQGKKTKLSSNNGVSE